MIAVAVVVVRRGAAGGRGAGECDRILSGDALQMRKNYKCAVIQSGLAPVEPVVSVGRRRSIL